MSTKWVKFHTDILNSSLMSEDIITKWVVFPVCVLLAREQDWEEGTFKATPHTLASRAMILGDPILAAADLDPCELVTKSLQILSSPDHESSSPDEEGRRLVPLGGNRWRVVNWPLYQDSPLRAKWRRDKRRQRGQVVDDDGHDVDMSGQVVDKKRTGGGPGADLPSVSVSVSDSISTPTPTLPTPKKSTTVTEKEEDLGFEEWWVAYPQGRRVKKAKALVIWGRMTSEERVMALAALGQHTEMWVREGRPIDKIPHPTTWLNARQWEDEIPDPAQYREKRKGGSVDMNVGKRVDPEESEKRRRKVRAAILTHWKHLKELEVEPELAMAVSVALDELGKLADNKAGLREGELGERFGQVHDRMLDAMVDHVMTEEEIEEMREWVGARHAHHEAAMNALGAHLRKAARERVGVNDICEYDWEG